MKVPPGEPVSDSPVNLLPDRVKERLFPIPVSPRIVSAVCPKAGDAKKIDQNMQKYREIDPKKSNDFASIRARFKAPGKKYRSLDHNSLFFAYLFVCLLRWRAQLKRWWRQRNLGATTANLLNS